MKVFFDLDGTLLDSSDRLYHLFCDLIPECKFSKEEYWELKRNKINHKMILEKYFPQHNFEDFNKKWLELIEDEKYLKLDRLYNFTNSLLNNKQEFYLITARQLKENLLSELEELNIKKFFKEIYVTENKKSKLDILKSLNLEKNDIFISDMGKDIKEGKEAGIKTIGVSWGFMSEEKLKEYSPDFLINNEKELDNILRFSKI